MLLGLAPLCFFIAWAIMSIPLLKLLLSSRARLGAAGAVTATLALLETGALEAWGASK